METARASQIPSYEEFLERAKRRSRSKEELLRQLEEEVRGYEQRYGMTTAKFLPRFERGDFEMEEHFVEYFDWRIAAHSIERIKRKINGIV